jgi:hypothetical protein
MVYDRKMVKFGLVGARALFGGSGGFFAGDEGITIVPSKPT